MEQSLPIRRSSFLVDMRYCTGGTRRREYNSVRRLGVPSFVLIIQPRISFDLEPNPVSLHGLFQAHEILHLIREGGENFFESLNSKLRYTVLLRRVPLRRTVEVIHTDVTVL